jgi:hypothetical protein
MTVSPAPPTQYKACMTYFAYKIFYTESEKRGSQAFEDIVRDVDNKHEHDKLTTCLLSDSANDRKMVLIFFIKY